MGTLTPSLNLPDYNAQYAATPGLMAPAEGLTLQGLISSLAQPNQIAQLRNQAQMALARGQGQLQDIGTSGGLNATQWGSLSNLLSGGMPQGGKVAGMDVVGNPLATMAGGQAQMADLQNKYNVQKAMADLQYGAPGALNQMQQNIADYSSPLIQKAFPTLDQFAAVNSSNIAGQNAALQGSLAKGELAYKTGQQPTGQTTTITGAGGQQYTQGTPGITPINSKYVMDVVNQDQITKNTANEYATLAQNASLSGVNAPASVIQNRHNLQDVLNAIDAEKVGPLAGGKYTATDPNIVAALKSANFNPNDAASVTQGKIQNLQKTVGMPTEMTNILSSLAPLANTPGYSNLVSSVFNNAQSGQLDINGLKAGLIGADKQYNQTTKLAPLQNENLHMNMPKSSGRTNLPQLTTDAIDRGYTDDLDNPTRDTAFLQAATQGIKIPPNLSQTMGVSKGYAGDYLNKAIKVGGGAQVFNNALDATIEHFKSMHNGAAPTPAQEQQFSTAVRQKLNQYQAQGGLPRAGE